MRSRDGCRGEACSDVSDDVGVWISIIESFGGNGPFLYQAEKLPNTSSIVGQSFRAITVFFLQTCFTNRLDEGLGSKSIVIVEVNS